MHILLYFTSFWELGNAEITNGSGKGRFNAPREKHPMRSGSLYINIPASGPPGGKISIMYAFLKMLKELSPVDHSSYFEKAHVHWIFFLINLTSSCLSLLICWTDTKINYLYPSLCLWLCFHEEPVLRQSDWKQTCHQHSYIQGT